MSHPVLHFEIIGRDGTTLSNFYRDVFGWRVEPPADGDPIHYHLMDPQPGSFYGIRGGIGTAPDGYDGHVTFYICVDDVESAFAKIEEHGGSRMMGPQAVPNGPVIGLFRDPEGRTVGLVDPGDRTMAAPMELVPYVFFYGRAREALEFYARVLGGSYEIGAQSDDGGILHAVVKAPGIAFAVTDGPPGARAIDPDAGNITLALRVADPAIAERTFAGLADGGTILMPFANATWGGKFGSLHDRFGNEWFVTSS
jgi:uncharacterized glyoxalase superfamily protein PhnB